jgi:hypothetical protein
MEIRIMSNTPLIDRSKFAIKLGHYATGTATNLSDTSYLTLAQDYRRRLGGQMFPLDGGSIRQRVPNGDYHASRKVDGEFTLLVYSNGEVFTINPGGTVRLGAPFHDEASKLLSNAGHDQIVLAGELYVDNATRRPRVHDVVRVARAPQSQAELDSLRFAVFDVVSVNGQWNPSFAERWKMIEAMLSKGQRIHPVEHRQIKNISEVEALFKEWVDDQDAEGIVLRSEQAGLFKIKPLLSLDTIVIGYTESTDDRAGMMHDLLLAIMRADGTMQVLCRVGGGFSEDLRRKMLSDLKDMTVASEYTEVNGDHVAYQMVRPDWIIEISCLDIISESTRGAPINRAVLEFDTTAGYKVVRRLPLATVISPQFIRIREDKRLHADDVGIQQITKWVEVQLADQDARQHRLPTAELVRREVFTKVLKGETMVRKFLVIKTNKHELSTEYPAYAIHYTDYSPNRKEPLSREVLVSNSLEQIDALYANLKTENVKKGWNAVQSDASA